jgi:hypothetical protein
MFERSVRAPRAGGRRRTAARCLARWRRDLLGRWGFVRARSYLAEQGVLPLLAPGNRAEFPPQLYDLYHLHRQVRRRRPAVVLEFGVGFSTLVIAHALARTHEDARRSAGARAAPGCLWSVDTSARWIENARAKLPPDLQAFVRFRQSAARACLWEGELCHLFETLPDVVPALLYLDGPDPAEVQGDVHGLRFGDEGGARRAVVSADPVLFESTVQPGFVLIVDGRQRNVEFLRRHLRRRYRFERNTVWDYSVFELLE